VWVLLPAAALVLLVALVASATLVPWLTGTLARRNESDQAAIRGELTASVVDLIEGAPELAVYGANDAQLAGANSHAIGRDFPHRCVHNQRREVPGHGTG
jgi:ABC-type transport system involved in cytochrome bd biosynthesis fused ATPase/permease subunit